MEHPQSRVTAANGRRLLDDSERAGSVGADARVFARILASSGPTAALAFLNERTRFRFTGVYRAEPPLLYNVHLYDRENPTLNVSGDVRRLDETYCEFVCGEDRPFDTPDAPADHRLEAHAARQRVQSYCGVPIRHASGRVWGTLCHFDARPRLLPRSEIALLELVAPCFAPRLPHGSPPR